MYKDIQKQFNDVISYSQGIESPETDELFEQWLSHKKHFIRRMNDALIYNAGLVTIKVGELERHSLFTDFVQDILSDFNNEELVDFINYNEKNFFDNKTEKSYSLPDGTEIPAGMKIIKAFRYFEKDNHILRIVQDRASRLIQEQEITGELCFSVHPLDFLSLSMNAHNWRSCHALDGEYRAGNLSYMVDPTTLICYIKASDDMELPLFPSSIHWNSKKWRMLLFFSEDNNMVFAGRQYPFASDGILDIILDKINSFFAISRDFKRWTNTYIDSHTFEDIYISEKHIPIRGRIYRFHDIVEDYESHTLHYNDLLHSSNYIYPYYTITGEQYWWLDEVPKVTMGGSVRCLQCGQKYLESSETMRCDDCELKYGHEENDTYCQCDCCGSRMYRDEATTVNDMDVVCEDCFKKYCFICEECNEVYYTTDRVYSKKVGDFICKYCKDLENEKES